MLGANWLRSLVFVCAVFPGIVSATEATGTGSMIPAPVLSVWAEAYSMHSPSSVIKFKGSLPAEGIKSLVNKQVDFAAIDMPLNVEQLKKNGLIQFPIALGAIAPVVNLPTVYPGQLKLDGKVLGDILLGNITRWNDPAIVELNPELNLPDAGIIIVHRVSPPGISTIIGDYLAKTNPRWKSIKGDGMAGSWPATAIEVTGPKENMDAIKSNPYSIGYAPIAHIMKNRLSYAQLRNQSGKFISPSDENISAAAENAKWDESNGLDVVLTDQPGASSWPLSMASYALMRKVSEQPERSREVLNYFKYSLRYGALRAVQNDFIPLPESVTAVVRSSWKAVVDNKGVPVLKN